MNRIRTNFTDSTLTYDLLPEGREKALTIARAQ
jgi:hypothetical protein